MYRLDSYDNALVIDGFQKGIADNPYSGIADMRNMNIVSIPGEASVGFSTSQISAPNAIGTMTNSSAAADTVTLTANPEPGSAIQFSVLSDATKGIALNTTYWAVGSGGTYQLYSDYGLLSLVNITANGLTGTWSTVNMSQPKYFVYDSHGIASWMIDIAGLVWSNARTTNNSPFYWTYTGNKPNNNSHGNGLLYYQASDGSGYIFAFSDSSIDYTSSNNTTISWNYQWNPTTGVSAGYNINPTAILKSAAGSSNSHEALLAPTNQAIFCDSNWVGRFYENNPAVPFNPATPATYVFDQTNLLPSTDKATCLTYLGTNILVGGNMNVIYPWNGVATTFNYPILLAEYNVAKMVTVNTTTYIFVGNRGRIYYTNGSNVQLYKKVPDHISGTVEPYFTWGGVTSTKNQIYFSFLVTTNAGTPITQYGGVWAIDVDTNGLRLTNKLSYATYAGYATALLPNFATNPAGTGLYIGWDSGATTYGIDTTTSTPYTGSQATIDSDLIPIGTFQQPRDFTKIEYKLSRPMVSGESITIKTRLIFNTTSTGYTTTFTDNTVGHFSSQGNINFKNAQWVQFQIVLNSTASSPSYVRLTEIRILGLTGPAAQSAQQLTLPNGVA